MQYVKIERAEQLEPGDMVYEVVRWGSAPDHVKYNAHKVMSVERQAVRAIRVDGQHQRPIKLSFKSLVMRAPDNDVRTAVVRRLPAPAAPSPPPSSSCADSFAAFRELSRGVLDEARVELRSVAEARQRVGAELEPVMTAHRRKIEALEAKLGEAREALAQDQRLAEEAVAALDERRAELETRIHALEGMIAAVK